MLISSGVPLSIALYSRSGPSPELYTFAMSSQFATGPPTETSYTLASSVPSGSFQDTVRLYSCSSVAGPLSITFIPVVVMYAGSLTGRTDIGMVVIVKPPEPSDISIWTEICPLKLGGALIKPGVSTA